MLLCGLLLGGCVSHQDEGVAAVAARFYQAIASKDGAAACALMEAATRSELEQSSGQPCETAVLGEGIQPVGDPVAVRTYETMGQVRYAGETAFLVDVGSGWRVMAAGCTPQPGDLPYDCKVKGA